LASVALRFFLQQRYYNSLMLPALTPASGLLKLSATMPSGFVCYANLARASIESALSSGFR
jgi:hypothetical protein